MLHSETLFQHHHHQQQTQNVRHLFLALAVILVSFSWLCSANLSYCLGELPRIEEINFNISQIWWFA